MLASAHNPVADDYAVALYADAMANDAWLQNGQPIVFDPAGRLIDGVQRLHAVIRSGRAIETLVAHNIRSDTLHTIDQHRRRNYTGVLESRGVENAARVVRAMGRLIRIENGALGRDPLSISWSRYDRVLESNPDIVEAVRISESFPRNELHSTPRAILTCQAIKAGRETELRDFISALRVDRPVTGFDAAAQAKMLLAGWNNDPAINIDVDKILGNAILYFNAFLNDEILPIGEVWNPDRGRLRELGGKWNPADTVIRHDKAEGFRQGDLALLLSDAEISAEQLRGIARKLPDPAIGDTDAVQLRSLLQHEARRQLVEQAAPANLGLPLVEGYPGLREGRINPRQRVEESGMVSELRNPGECSGVTARVVLITPDLARKWLSEGINRGNRKIQLNHVKAIARDISNERWMMNAQPIVFTGDPFSASAPDLRLLNGQHRLRAVIEADIPVEAPIALNVPERAFATFDVHPKRSLRFLERSAVIDDRVLAAAARLQWREDNGIDLMVKHSSPTAGEIMETIERHPGMGEFFARSRRKGIANMGSAGIMTYFMYRLSRESPALAENFLNDLEYGEALTRENPVRDLRDELNKGRVRLSRKSILDRLLRAWNTYRKWQEALPATG
ncbi:hypothetical protein [Paracoccus ravus]|uniref:hypothetical protein n=1 Tax=Paracoccus ravus TaxID=2447760 RepID=UPI001ADA58D2|nr:hypothetical protein [Paracoccus ravus]